MIFSDIDVSERFIARLCHDLRALLADRRAVADERQLSLW